MKNPLIISVFTAILLFSGRCQAIFFPGGVDPFSDPPSMNAGIKLGANYSRMAGDQTYVGSYKPGILGGFYAGVNNGSIGVRFEAVLNSARYDLKDSFQGGGYFKLLTLDIPILAEYKIVPWLWVIAGPQFSTLLSARQLPHEPNDAKSFFQSSNFSGVIGLEVKPVKIVAIGARYLLGFTNVNDEYNSVSSQKWKTSGLQFYVSLKIL